MAIITPIRCAAAAGRLINKEKKAFKPSGKKSVQFKANGKH